MSMTFDAMLNLMRLQSIGLAIDLPFCPSYFSPELASQQPLALDHRTPSRPQAKLHSQPGAQLKAVLVLSVQLPHLSTVRDHNYDITLTFT